MAAGDGFERGLQISMRVNRIHFGRLDQSCDTGPGRGTLVMAGEQRILAIQSQRAERGSSRELAVLDCASSLNTPRTRRPETLGQRQSNRSGKNWLTLDKRSRHLSIVGDR